MGLDDEESLDAVLSRAKDPSLCSDDKKRRAGNNKWEMLSSLEKTI